MGSFTKIHERLHCMTQVDLLIIGAGPVGLSCGIAAQKAGLTYKIIDKGCLVNSLYNFPSDMTFFSSSDKLEIGDIPFSSLALRPSKKEALEYYRRVAQHYNLNIGLYESFENLNPISGIDPTAKFKVQTSKEEYPCANIINATGFYDNPRRFDIPGENLKKTHHYFTSAHHLYKQNVTVVGASNSAIDVALEAYRKGANVTLLIRRDIIRDNVKYWIKPDIEARIKEGSIKAYFNVELLEISDTHTIFKQEGKKIEIESDFVYAMTGYKPNFNLLQQLGITINDDFTPLHNPSSLETNVSGIYIAGVVCGGLNTREWFIENSRSHGEMIVVDILLKKSIL